MVLGLVPVALSVLEPVVEFGAQPHGRLPMTVPMIDGKSSSTPRAVTPPMIVVRMGGCVVVGRMVYVAVELVPRPVAVSALFPIGCHRVACAAGVRHWPRSH